MAYDNRPENVSGTHFHLNVTEEMKKYVFEKARKSGITVSQVMRDLIKADMERS